MKIIHIDIMNKKAFGWTRDGAIVCGNSDYKVAFTFDSEWDGINEKTARFKWCGQYYDVPFTGTECDVPIIMDAATVEIGVYAGELRTTTGADIPCLRSILSGGATARPEFGGNYTTEAEAAAKAAKASANEAAQAATKAAKEAAEAANEELRTVIEGVVVQEPGDSATAVMSQKAVTDTFGLEFVTGKNLADPSKFSPLGQYYNYTNGKQEFYPTNQYIANYSHSDFIRVEAGKTYTWSGGTKTQGYHYCYGYAIFDADKQYLTGAAPNVYEPLSVTIPEGGAFIVLDFSSLAATSYVQLEEGPEATAYEDFHGHMAAHGVRFSREQIDDMEIVEEYTEEEAPEGVVPVLARKALVDVLGLKRKTGKNLFDVSKISPQGQWYTFDTGKQEFYPANQYISKYAHSDFIPVEAGESYTLSGSEVLGQHNIYAYVIFDANKSFVTGALISAKAPATVTIPDGGAFIVIDFDNIIKSTYTQLEKGVEFTGYEAYEEYTALDAIRLDKSQIVEGAAEDNSDRLLHLPKKYDLVVGDTFELFYKGVMLCKDPARYNIEVECAIGKAWGRKFEVTPTTAGTYTLTVRVTDDFDNLIDQAAVTLNVRAKATSPASQVNVLCVGDSLTAGGTWVGEFHRRLARTSNNTIDGKPAPTGDGLNNIRFIGKKQTSTGAGYEGFGGWRFADYLATSSTTANYWVTCTHSKTDSDQESIYKDANGVQWQLETIEASRLKFKKYSGTGSLPYTGTLTWVSGGIDTSPITYSAASLEEGNPFVYNGAVNFNAYCADLGVAKIDRCFILLGWNNASSTEAAYKADAKAFIDKLIAHNANIKITLMGLQIPSLDGCANNYGASGAYSKYRGLQKFVFNLDKWHQDLADEYPGNITTVNVAGQFDTENNMPTTDLPLTARNATTAKVGSNGVHPAIEGYYQIADAAYRHFTATNG